MMTVVFLIIGPYITMPAVPYGRRLVAGLSSRRTTFALGSVYVGFVVDKVALGQFFSEFFGFTTSISLRHDFPRSYIT
jgi:hypothetical protein